MASLNKVFLMGNLTRDPELTFTPGGTAICKFGLAINRRFSQNGQDKDETCFLEIVVWGKQAETSARFLQKGANVFIEGRLTYEQWTEKDTQKKRSQIRVTAERVQFMNARRDDMGGDSDGGYDDSSSYQGQQQGNSSSRPYQPRQQQYQGRQQGQQRSAQDEPPQMPPQEEYPYEDVGGVDDDIPF